MGKKGISPLIATVLIIGFTIVLATLIMNWIGTRFTDIQDSTRASSKSKIACISQLSNLDLSASLDTDITIKIDNKNNIAIEGFILRLYDEIGEVKTYDINTTIKSFDIKEIRLQSILTKNQISSIIPLSVITKIGIIPKIDLDDQKINCENELITEVIIHNSSQSFSNAPINPNQKPNSNNNIIQESHYSSMKKVFKGYI